MPDLILTEQDDGRTLDVTVGTYVTISLYENPTTGYRWSVCGFGSTSLTLESDDYALPSASAIGGGGIRSFRFLAQAPATTKIDLKNKREWESEMLAVDTFAAVITVHP